MSQSEFDDIKINMNKHPDIAFMLNKNGQIVHYNLHFKHKLKDFIHDINKTRKITSILNGTK